MTKLEKTVFPMDEIFPNILDAKTVKICTGVRDPKQASPVPEDLIDGVLFTADRCIVLYGNHTREEIFEIWKKEGFSKIHLSGGWGNPGQLEMLTLCSLDGTVPLRERTVGDVMEAHQKGMMLKISHDYFKAWRELFQRKADEEGKVYGKEEFKILFLKQKIGDLLTVGSPISWELCLFDKKTRTVLMKSVSNPYEGQATEPGCLNVVRLGDLRISNATGAKGDGTFALNCLMVLLTNDRKTARKFYVENALNRARILVKSGKTVLFSKPDIEILADEFLNSAELVKLDIGRILSSYDASEILAFQYAENVTIVNNLPARIDTMSRAQDYCWIKTEKGWELAV